MNQTLLHIFIGCTVEMLPFAQAIRARLNQDERIAACVWNEGPFSLTRNGFENLQEMPDQYDLGIFLFAPDKVMLSPTGKLPNSGRGNGNIILEFGLFVSRGKERAIMLTPDEPTHLLPSNLDGLNRIFFSHPPHGEFDKALEQVWPKLKNHLEKLFHQKKFAGSCRTLKGKLQRITQIIGNIHRYSVAYALISKEVAQTLSRAEGLANHHLSIDHKTANGKVLQVYSHPLAEMRAGDTYFAISQYRFWKNIMRESPQSFLYANMRAALSKAQLKRLFMIDQHRWESDQRYRESFLAIIKGNAGLRQKGHKNVEIKYRFAEGVESGACGIENFAIMALKTHQEEILFLPDHQGLNIAQTHLIMVDHKHPTHPNYELHLKKISQYRNEFEMLWEDPESKTPECLTDA